MNLEKIKNGVWPPGVLLHPLEKSECKFMNSKLIYKAINGKSLKIYHTKFELLIHASDREMEESLHKFTHTNRQTINHNSLKQHFFNDCN